MWQIVKGLFSIPSLISGLFTTVTTVTGQLANEKVQLANAKNDEERIAAQERVNTLTLRRDLMIAEATTSKLNIRMRAAMAACVLVVLAKIIVWDKSIGPFFGCVGKITDAAQIAACKMFVTDSLDDNIWHVVMVVIGFYFLSEAATFFKRK